MFNQRLTRSRFRDRIITQPQSNYSSIVNSRNGSYDGLEDQQRRNSLCVFQNQLNQYLFKEKNQKMKLLRKQKKLRESNKQLQKQSQLSDIKINLDSLKNKIEVYKKKRQINETIGLLIQRNAKQKLGQKKMNLPFINNPSLQIPPPPLPNYLSSPIPIPPSYPFFYPSPSNKPNKSQRKRKSSLSSESQQQEDRRPEPTKLKRNNLKNKMKMKKVDKQKMRQKLGRLLKVVFLAVSYYFYLKNLSKKIMAKRRIIFNKFWPDNFFKSTNAMRKWFASGSKPFFDQMIKKSEVQIQIDGDQSMPVINQKKKTIKILINILIKSIQNIVQNKTFEQITQILHIFCKHGAFIQNGVLTPQQLQTVCISDVHGYLRMDKYIQKSQIINFFFLKLILFNILLQPWKYNENVFNISQNTQGYQNFYYISSILYQIFLFLQDKYLDSSNNELIQIGNWRKMKTKYKIKCSPSLCHLQNNHESGEFISGLINENIINQHLPISFWAQQIQILQNIIEKIHKTLRKIHNKLINQIYQYKDMKKFQQNNQ